MNNLGDCLRESHVHFVDKDFYELCANAEMGEVKGDNNIR